MSQMLTSVYCAHGVQCTHMTTVHTQRLYTPIGCQNHCASTIMEIMEWLLGLIIRGCAILIFGRIQGGGGVKI